MNFRKIEEKWQKIWEEKKVFEPEVDESRPKFFLTVPYPYMSGLLHLGNAYTFARGEFIARFKRMKGFNVLWPQGWHITGAPIVANALRLREGDPKIQRDLEIQGIPKEDWEKLKTPEGWALYFIEKNREAFKKFGFSIDWRREFYTSYLNSWYSKFIEWQYRKLKEKGLITKGKHPVVWDPKVNMVIGDHDRPDEYAGIGPIEGYIIKFYLDSSEILEKIKKAYEEEYGIKIEEPYEKVIKEFTKKVEDKDKVEAFKEFIKLLKEKPKFVLPCFTLRPETIYGVTNVWINPEAEYGIYKVNNEYWILPKTIVIEELKNQDFDVKPAHIKLSGTTLLGKYVENPLTKEKVPILPAKFVDPEIGTGIVMSVPAHAPYDYRALLDIVEEKYFPEFKEIAKKALENMKVLFKLEGFEISAKEIVEKMKIRSQDEKEKLEKATQEIYSKEFYNGILKEIYGKYAGKKIYEVKEEFANELIEKGIAIKYYTLPVRFKSRYGGKVIVKIVKDQWFIRYSDPEWKKLAHECVDQMKFIPEEIRKMFHQTIDWLKDWAFTHKRELGTPLPWDPDWTIESLSDSTIYMAYYTIAHLIKKIPPEKIEDDLFDYVFLGKGDEKELFKKYGEIIKEMRKEFTYWYPVDLRTSGKDLIQNHLTFFIFHHVAIFPKEYWPKAIAINGWVLMEGRKMSKSLGNVIPMLKAVREYPADVIRFLLAYAGNSGLDDANIEWSKAKEIEKELKEWYEFAIENYGKGKEEKTLIDEWFENYLNKVIKKVEKEYENMNFRNVLIKGWYELQNAFKWYLKFNPNKDVLKRFIEIQTLILYPLCPHICSEILEKIKGFEFALKPSWPEVKEYNEEIAKVKDFVDNLRSDILRIIQITKKQPKEIKIIVAKEEKYKIFDKAREIVKEKGLKEITKELVKEFGKEVVPIAQRIFKDPGLLNCYLRRDLELRVLNEIKDVLEKEFNARIIIEKEEVSKEIKARNALPGKPAIIIK